MRKRGRAIGPERYARGGFPPSERSFIVLDWGLVAQEEDADEERDDEVLNANPM